MGMRTGGMEWNKVRERQPAPVQLAAAVGGRVGPGAQATGKKTPDVTTGSKTDSIFIGNGGTSTLSVTTPFPVTVNRRTSDEHAFFWKAYDFATREKAAAAERHDLQVIDGVETCRPTVAQSLQASFARVSAGIKQFFSIRNASANVLTAKPLTGFYGGFSINAAGKATSGSLSAAHISSPGADVGLNGGGLAFALADGVFSAKDAIDLEGSIDTAKNQLMRHAQGACRFLLDSQNESVEDAVAYRSFMAAARKVPELDRDASDGFFRARLSAVRDGAPVMAGAIAVNAKNIGVAAHTVGTIAGAGLGIAAGAAAMISAPVDIVQGVSEHKTAQRNIAAIEKRGERLQGWKKTPTPSKLRQAVAKAYGHHQGRLLRQEQRASVFASLRSGKGVLAFGLGSASAAASIAVLCGVATAATGGLFLGIAAGVLGTFFLGMVAYKQYRRWKTENTSKQRQRQAQALIATHSFEQLLDMCERGECKRVAFESGGKLEYQTVRVSENEYLALHLVAVRLARHIAGSGNAYDDAEVREFLEIIGFDELDIKALIRVVRAEPSDRQVEFIKMQIAGAFGAPFRTENGRERALPAQVYIDAVEEVFANFEIDGSQYVNEIVRNAEKDQLSKNVFPEIAASLAQRLDADRFIDAMVSQIEVQKMRKQTSQDDAEIRGDDTRRMLSEFAVWLDMKKKGLAGIHFPVAHVQVPGAMAELLR